MKPVSTGRFAAVPWVAEPPRKQPQEKPLPRPPAGRWDTGA